MNTHTTKKTRRVEVTKGPVPRPLGRPSLTMLVSVSGMLQALASSVIDVVIIMELPPQPPQKVREGIREETNPLKGTRPLNPHATKNVVDPPPDPTPHQVEVLLVEAATVRKERKVMARNRNVARKLPRVPLHLHSYSKLSRCKQATPSD